MAATSVYESIPETLTQCDFGMPSVPEAPEYERVAKEYGFTRAEIRAWVNANDAGATFEELALVLAETPIPHTSEMTPQRKKDEAALVGRLTALVAQKKAMQGTAVFSGFPLPYYYESTKAKVKVKPDSTWLVNDFYSFALNQTDYFATKSSLLYVVSGGSIQPPTQSLTGGMKAKAHDWLPGFVVVSAT
jgi:hypothetical protein